MTFREISGETIIANDKIIRRKGLLALAERCEAATGPDWVIETAIAAALGWRTLEKPNGQLEAYTVEGGWFPLPRFTASLDAALTMVPEGLSWTAASAKQDISARPFAAVGNDIAEAATPALALCAASLRALAVA